MPIDAAATVLESWAPAIGFDAACSAIGEDADTVLSGGLEIYYKKLGARYTAVDDESDVHDCGCWPAGPPR